MFYGRILWSLQSYNFAPMSSFMLQFTTVLRKNMMLNFRTRTTFRQLINIGIIFGVIMALTYSSGSSSKQVIPVYMSLAILMFCRGVAMSWVAEKQTKQAELQHIMGITNRAYFAGWFASFLITGVALSLIFTGLLNATNIYSETDVSFGEMLGLYLLYLFASFGFVLFLSSFFSDATLASQLITFVQIISSFLFYLLNIKGFRESTAALGFTSILPSLCFQYTVLGLGFGEYSGWSTPFTSTQGFITLGSLGCAYLLLFVYLELVLPNENGSNLHPLFFLQCCKKSKPYSDLDESFQLQNLSSARYYQPTKEAKRISLWAKDMSKSFDSKKVVNDLSLSLFERQVFCLLGHNGAGKSTTINILTGILKPDGGSINIFGYDYYTQMDQIRRKTGACLQVDVLYEDMTVREHIEYYAAIKNIPPEQQRMAVDQILEKCGIVGEQEKRTKNLSGGNKRKTCLACAAVGGSQLLFLDEPSSGLDPNSRRTIWQLIRDLKAEGRTIVLTTHHLEQAEALADRIGILAHGQLLVLGSSHYIKQRFSCGYHLSLALNPQLPLEDQRKTIRHRVLEIVGKQVIEDEQVGQTAMKFMLPFDRQETFSDLFKILEEQGFQFSLSLSSLEDIFVKLGMDPDSVLNNQPIPQLQKIELPGYNPLYNFSSQFKAIFMNKFRVTTRSFAVFISIFLPIIYIIIGIVLSFEAYDSNTTSEDGLVNSWVQYYIIAFFFCLAFSFNTASYCGSIVQQRQIQWKYLCYVMGMSKVAYWLGTIAFDLLMLCLPLGLVFIVIACFPSENSQWVSSFGWLALTLILFAFSFLSFTYLWSFAFDKAKTAYRFYPFLVFLFFFVLPTIPIYIVPHAEVIQWVLPLVSPLMCLNSCILSKEMFGASAYDSLKSNSYGVNVYLTDHIAWPLSVMVMQTALFLILTFVLDNLKFTLKDRQQIDRDEAAHKQSEDVQREKTKIMEGEARQPIVVDDLYKKYPNGYVAIRDNSFVVDQGETFGLLGPNGAGKSTTFNILTAAIPKTRGRVMMAGSEVNRSVDEIFTKVGVCPQFNPIYEMLTVEEHISFFAGLKGLQGQQRQHLLDFYISQMQLSEYREVRAGKLSGGNKRKLCVTMALVGNPQLVFLDEPSAGVDPIARRYLWNVLHSANQHKRRSIVLTTHSINEAESLCDRIGILIKGEFFCIDSPRELKKRYGKGYRATIQCENADLMKRADAQVQKVFKNYKKEVFEEQLKIAYEFEKGGFVFSEAFQLFYNGLKKQGLITAFELAETTLEEVFIFLSRMQGEEEFVKLQEQSNFCCCYRNSQGCFCLC